MAGNKTGAHLSHQTALNTSDDTVASASSLYSLGLTQKKSGDLKSAAQSLGRSLDIRLKLLGGHKDTAWSYFSLALVQDALMDYKSAVQSHQGALDIRKKVLGEHLDTAWSYYSLGNSQRKLGDNAASLKSHQCALELRVKLLGNHKDTAASFYSVGLLQNTSGDQQSALQSHLRAVDMRQRTLGDHTDTAWSFYCLGLVQKSLGDLRGSMQSQISALHLRQSLLGEHKDTAASYFSVALLHKAMGDMNGSLECHYKALDMRFKLLGSHGDTAVSYACLGQSQYDVRDYMGALQSHQGALNIRLNLLGDHKDTVTAYQAVIRDLEKLGDLEKMKEMKTKCDEMQGRLEKKKSKPGTELAAVRPEVPPGTTPGVFISYQWCLRDTAQELKKKLEESGIHCWMDINQLGGGDALFAAIDAGIRTSKVMICCVTEKYCQSEICQREVTLADALQKPIIPVLFEQIPWPPAGQLALIFAKLLYINMAHGSEALPSDKLNELLHKIQLHVSKG